MGVIDTMIGYPPAFGGPSGSAASFHHSCGSIEFNYFHDSNSSLDQSLHSVFEEIKEKSPPTSPNFLDSLMEEEAEEEPFCLEFEPDEEDADENDNSDSDSLFVDLSMSWPVAKVAPKLPTTSTHGTSKTKTAKSKQEKLPPRTTKVRFAPTHEIREYNLILGDHPMCEDGLAIDMGWEYEITKDLCQNPVLQTKLQSTKSPRWRTLGRTPPTTQRDISPTNNNLGGAKLRSYEERKQLLLSAGGITEAELGHQLLQMRLESDHSLNYDEVFDDCHFDGNDSDASFCDQDTTQRGYIDWGDETDSEEFVRSPPQDNPQPPRRSSSSNSLYAAMA